MVNCGLGFRYIFRPHVHGFWKVIAFYHAHDFDISGLKPLLIQAFYVVLSSPI